MKKKKTRIKQFGQELKELCKKEAMVATTTFYGRDHKVILGGRLLQLRCSVVATMEHYHQLFGSRPQSFLAATEFYILQCGRDHTMIVA